MVTIKDIARIANVDKSTVSRALNNSKRISEKVREEIQKIAKELNYYPNASAYSLRKKINRSIALVVPELKFPGGEFFQEVLRGIDTVLETSNFNMIFAKYSKTDNTFFRVLQERRIDGALIIGDVFTVEDLEEIDKLNIPMILLNFKLLREMDHLLDVYTDNEFGGALAAEHLIKTHQKKDILFIGGGNKYQATRMRYQGFMEVINRFNKEGNNVKVELMHADFEFAFPLSIQLMTDLIKNNKLHYDAIFAASDNIALGIMNVLMKNNIRVPEEISIISYDNIQITNFYPVSITSIEQNAYLMGRNGTEILMDKILKRDEKEHHEKHISIKPELIIRRSCGCQHNV